MAAEKLVTLFGLLGKLEGSYDGGGSLSNATDGLLMMEPVVMGLEYVHSGERGQQPGAGGVIERAAKSGLFGEFAPRFEGRGSGVEYTAAVYPPDLHVMMLIAGHAGASTLKAGGVLAAWTYTPESGPTGFDSGVFEGYSRGQMYPIQACYAGLNITGEAGGFAIFEFPAFGKVTIPTDVSLPVITYQDLSARPPKLTNLNLKIGGVNSGWKLRSFAFNMNRAIDPRPDASGDGHAGYSPGRREATLELVVEARAVATFDPFTQRDTSASLAVSLEVGAPLPSAATATGTATSANGAGTLLTDTAGDFIVDGVAVGDVIQNISDGSRGVVTARTATTITHTALAGGTQNDWDIGETYSVWTPDYNRFTLAADQYQITNVAEGEDGATALWTLSGICAASTPIANDDYSLVFN